MKKDDFKTDVIFRRWINPKTINKVKFALFPYVINDNQGNCLSYEQIGQHSGADYKGCIERSVPATPREYKDLKSELESIVYNLNIIKRRNYDKYLKAIKELNNN